MVRSILYGEQAPGPLQQSPEGRNAKPENSIRDMSVWFQ